MSALAFMPSPTVWAMRLAAPAPASSSVGKKNHPKMRKGLRARWSIREAEAALRGVMLSPDAWRAPAVSRWRPIMDMATSWKRIYPAACLTTSSLGSEQA